MKEISLSLFLLLSTIVQLSAEAYPVAKRTIEVSDPVGDILDEKEYRGLVKERWTYADIKNVGVEYEKDSMTVHLDLASGVLGEKKRKFAVHLFFETFDSVRERTRGKFGSPVFFQNDLDRLFDDFSLPFDLSKKQKDEIKLKKQISLNKIGSNFTFARLSNQYSYLLEKLKGDRKYMNQFRSAKETKNFEDKYISFRSRLDARIAYNPEDDKWFRKVNFSRSFKPYDRLRKTRQIIFKGEPKISGETITFTIKFTKFAHQMTLLDQLNFLLVTEVWGTFADEVFVTQSGLLPSSS